MPAATPRAGGAIRTFDEGGGIAPRAGPGHQCPRFPDVFIQWRVPQRDGESVGVEPDAGGQVPQRLLAHDVPRLDVVRPLDGLEHRQLEARAEAAGGKHGREHGAGIEHERVAHQQLLVVFTPEGLAGHRRDALVRGADLRAHQQGRRDHGPQRAAVQVQLAVRQRGSRGEQGSGRVAPAAQRIVDVTQSHHASAGGGPASQGEGML